MSSSTSKRRGFLVASLGLASAAAAQDRQSATLEVAAKDTTRLPWKEEMNEKLHRNYFVKSLVKDPDTGMEVLVLRYPAGLVVPSHTHPCSHGMYVLEGVLVTHEGRYPAGTFVWFPEGLKMEHGATPERDVTVLFVTNKPFGIKYV